MPQHRSSMTIMINFRLNSNHADASRIMFKILSSLCFSTWELMSLLNHCCPQNLYGMCGDGNFMALMLHHRSTAVFIGMRFVKATYHSDYISFRWAKKETHPINLLISSKMDDELGLSNHIKPCSPHFNMAASAENVKTKSFLF